MSQQDANRFRLRRAGRATAAVWAVVLLSVGPLAAQQPAETSSQTNPPAVKAPTVITSDRLEVDYAHNIYTFKDNVLAVDPQITLRADKMMVFSGTTSNAVSSTNAAAASAGATPTIQKIIATGSVHITQEKKRATCGRAVYTADDGGIVLTENPKVESPDGTVTGEKITFWRGQDRMDVESGTRLVVFPENTNSPALNQTNAPPKVSVTP